MRMNPDHARAASRGGLLFGAVLILAGCSMVTPQDISDIRADERPVGATLTKLGEKGGAARDALTLWNHYAASVGLETLTYDDEDGYIDLALTAAAVLGAVSPISAAVYDDPVDGACATMLAGNRNNADGLALLARQGCAP